jgi:MATE family multidrug resistance protein
LLRLALPLILSSSFLTLQITIDRILLSHYDPNAVAAAMPAVMLFWTPFILLQSTASYATTFVAQYLGAGRKQRVGPAVWQAIYFSVPAGLAFLLLVPLAPVLFDLGDHDPAIREMEVTFFRCLCFAALPHLLTASFNSFFAGRGESWMVLLIDATGLTVTAVLDYLWIFGYAGFPAWGIAGAGWATVTGNTVSALLGLGLMLRRRYRTEFATLSGWSFDGALFRRLLRFGLPNGLLWALDGVAFTLFIFLVGRLGRPEAAATSIAFTINAVAIIPMFGLCQAISVLVGQRLGQNRADLAERTTWTGFRLTWLYMAMIALLYIVIPEGFVLLFRSEANVQEWESVAQLVPVLLRFVAVYSLFDSMNLVFSFALRGAGDTRYVTKMALALSWPLMVVPTWATWRFHWGLYPAWTFASAYIIALALVFLLRFRRGKWKSMRVIETAPVLQELEPGPLLAEQQVA